MQLCVGLEVIQVYGGKAAGEELQLGRRENGDQVLKEGGREGGREGGEVNVMLAFDRGREGGREGEREGGREGVPWGPDRGGR